MTLPQSAWALPQLRAVFDPANFIQCGQDTKPAWELLSPYVEYMHIKDALPDGSVVPAGKGAGELPFLLSQYKGEVLTVEPHLSVFAGIALVAVCKLLEFRMSILVLKEMSAFELKAWLGVTLYVSYFADVFMGAALSFPKLAFICAAALGLVLIVRSDKA